MADPNPSPDAAQRGPEYPPETYRLMSWSAIRFIHRPPFRPLAWAIWAIAGLLGGLLLGAFFYRIDVKAPALGEIVARPGVLLQYDVLPNDNVKAGQSAATILPQGAELLARLDVEARDMANVAVGQAVYHKIDAYPYQRYGLFRGEVLSVEQSSQERGALHYAVFASARNPDHISDKLAENVRLVRGMKMRTGIKTGSRTVYDLAVDSFFGK